MECRWHYYGLWTNKWLIMIRYKQINNEVIQLTAEEIAQRQAEEQAWLNGAFDRAMADLRAKRNRLLTESDWTILPDSPIADKTAWQVYRQNLRDLTEGITTKEQANAVVFPTKP